jgi:FkbM family methyltransferase
MFEYTHPLIGRFVYHPCDYLSRRVFLYDDFELAELGFAIEHARGGGIILDVGANIGLYAAACATAAGDRGAVIAIEPGPRTFAKLTATCQRLGLLNVTALNVAAGARAGTAVLVGDRDGNDVHQHLADSRPDTGADHVTVETRRLDDVCAAEAVTLIKLDVEGHEVDALAGAERILARRRARLIVECYPAALRAAGTSVDQFWTVLARTHQCLAVIAGDGSTRPAGRGSLDADGAEETFNTLWSPRAADPASPRLRAGLAEVRGCEGPSRTKADAVHMAPGAC